MTNVIEDYLKKKASSIDEENEQTTSEKNDSPCEKCGGRDYIQLYRNVVGNIEGSMSGNFSLFGGSVHGRISGYTKTLPILSCTQCHNEKTILTWEYTFERDLFWEDMHYFYFFYDKDEDKLPEIKSIYLNNPRQTREYMISHPNIEYSFYNEMTTWPESIWERVGFKIPTTKTKRRFLFWKWEEENFVNFEDLKD